mgnify:CR=1 FL=1
MRLTSLILAFVATLGSCAEPNQVWGIPRDTFSERLQSGNHDFLLQLDYRELDIDEITRLRPGAAFYVAEIYGELGLDMMRRRMLAVELEQGREPWRRRAAEALLSQLGEEERWEELESAADTALEIYPGEPAFTLARYAALYEQGADREILAALRAEDGDLSPFLTRPAADERRLEVELWATVAAFRTRAQDWEDRMRSFFLDFPAAPQHSRLYVFIIARSAAQMPFSAAELSLFSAKARAAEGSYAEAARVFLELAAGSEAVIEPGAPPATQWLLQDMGFAFLRAGYRTRGIPILEDHAAAARTAVTRARALEYAGRLYRSRGDVATAEEYLAAALELYTGSTDRRRAVRHLTEARMSTDPAGAVDVLARYPDAAASAWYFNRLLDRLASELVRREAWAALERSGGVLADIGLAEAADRFHYLAAEAALFGYHDAAPQPLLERIGTDPYYRLLAAARLGRAEGLVAGAEGDDTPGAAAGNAGAADGNAGAAGNPGAAAGNAGAAGNPGASDGKPARALVAGYLDVALYEHAYEAATDQSDALSVDFIQHVSARIQDQGLYIESLRLMARARRRPEFTLSPEAARILYPRAFSQAMKSVVRREKLDLPVFYGLVREESHFAADIMSHAGATGLAQLMPATAADMARRMRIEDPELTDPVTNLSIGGFYLSYLLGRFDGEWMPALAAYNGGQGRVRRWVRENGRLNGPLFHGAMPIYETRHYIRKVLVSAAHYGELYEGRPAAETVRLLFPEITPITEAET